jgi:hypothetical protein
MPPDSLVRKQARQNDGSRLYLAFTHVVNRVPPTVLNGAWIRPSQWEADELAFALSSKRRGLLRKFPKKYKGANAVISRQSSKDQTISFIVNLNVFKLPALS